MHWTVCQHHKAIAYYFPSKNEGKLKRTEDRKLQRLRLFSGQQTAIKYRVIAIENKN